MIFIFDLGASKLVFLLGYVLVKLFISILKGGSLICYLYYLHFYLAQVPTLLLKSLQQVLIHHL